MGHVSGPYITSARTPTATVRVQASLGFHSYVRTDGDDGDGQGSQVAPARVARFLARRRREIFRVNTREHCDFNAFFLLTNEQQPQAVEARATGTWLTINSFICVHVRAPARTHDAKLEVASLSRPCHELSCRNAVYILCLVSRWKLVQQRQASLPMR